MKLTPETVREIHRRRAAGEKLLTIALDLGVCEQTISLAARGITHNGRRPGRPRKSA